MSTVIIGLIDKDSVWLGADTCVSDYSHKTVAINGKTWVKERESDHVLFGFASCGSPRVAQLLRFKLNIPLQKELVGDYEYMVTDFMDAVRSCLRSGGSLKKEDEIEVIQGYSSFIVSYNKKLYSIYWDLQLTIGNDLYIAEGSGRDYALGSLASTDKLKSSEKRMLLALQASEKFDPHVSSPFQIIKIKDNKYKEMVYS